MKPLAVVTTGPSSEPIDEVRSITNSASGEIGSLLAGALARRGFHVFLFRGRGATHRDAPPEATVHEFTTNRDLVRSLQELAAARGREVHAFFHAAALSDYAVAGVRGPDGLPQQGRKIPGELSEIHLLLEPAAKVLPRLRGWFPQAHITGWKYELDGTREDAMQNARLQIGQGRTDCTVVNGSAYGPGFGLFEAQNPPLHFDTKRELADFLASRTPSPAKPLK